MMLSETTVMLSETGKEPVEKIRTGDASGSGNDRGTELTVRQGREAGEGRQGREAGEVSRTILDIVSTDENEELEKYLAYIHTVYSVFGFGLWTVELRDGTIIGRCGLQPIADDHSPLGRIELGYLIDRPYRNRGYAYEACRAILDFAFDKLELDEVYALIDKQNEPSMRLAKKLGFVRPAEDLGKEELWKVTGSRRHAYAMDKKKKCPKSKITVEKTTGENPSTTKTKTEYTEFKKVSKTGNCDAFGCEVILG